MLGWLVDGDQNDTASAEVLVFDQSVGIAVLHFRQTFEELRETFKGNIVAVIISRLMANEKRKFGIITSIIFRKRKNSFEIVN